MKKQLRLVLVVIGVWGWVAVTQAAEGTTPVPVTELKVTQVHDVGEARLYPAFGGDRARTSPRVKIRDVKSSAFGVDVKISWTVDAIAFAFDVQDPTPGYTVGGAVMWTGDSVQFAIDTASDQRKTRYTDSCYELGLALTSAGQMIHYAWQSGGQGEFDWNGVATSGKRTATGYQMEMSVPWKNLGLNPNALPKSLGINVLVNDVAAAGERRFVEWTPGIGEKKDPSEFKRVLLVGASATNSVACLTVDHPSYGAQDSVAGQYEEYAVQNLPSMQLELILHGNGKTFHMGTQTVPAVTTGTVRQVRFVFPAKDLAEGKYRLSVQTTNVPSSELARTSFQRTDLSPRIQALLKEQRNHLLTVTSLLAAQPELAKDDYIRLGVAIAERFLQRVEDAHPQQSLDWSWLQVKEVQEVLDQTEARIKLAAKARPKPERVPRPTGGPVTIRDGIFYAETTVGDHSEVVQRPCFFDGYGAFGQVAEDIPSLPKFGVTLVQQERGPSSMNADGSLNAWGREGLEVFKSAAAHRIKVDFLLSPHYFPQWAIDQSPDVVPSTDSGNLGYNIDHPKAREVIQRWLETIIPAVKDELALFSFCLANEPQYHYSGRDPHSRPAWVAYLQQQHGTIAALNALYGKHYPGFTEVPVPDRRMPWGVDGQRAYYDWVRFNQRHFADWFQWMNGIVKKAAPATPTHIKILATRFFHRLLDTGIDPELLCQVTDLAGNDGETFTLPSGPYACDWQQEEIWYDLLHSFGGQPVFDSENHFIEQGSPPVRLPPDHVRSVLWQGAVHHLAATSMWVWHEPDEAVEWLKGTIYLRPANLYAAGQTMLDLNRLAPEVAAVSQAKPKVALLYSMPSYFWQEDYLGMVKKVYTALTFLGQPVTFVSERQLAEGRAAKVACIILPQATHVQDTTVAALEKFVATGGRVLMVGPDCLGWDEYHCPRKRPQGLGTIAPIEATTDEQHLLTSLRPVLADAGLELTAMRDAGDKTFAWGVEYRTVPYREGLLVPLISFLRHPQVVQLSLQGAATDLLSNEPVRLDRIRLNPMQPRLLWLPARP